MASREQRLAIVVVARDLASGNLRGINRELERMGSRGGLAQAARGVSTLGAGIARVGVVAAAAAIGGLTAAAKAGIDFQDAFAGVRKTVEGTPAEMDALYASLRQLAMRIPVKFTDLALIAQEAGALGVKAKDIEAFTEAVARTSAATVGLTTAAASEAFGKLGSLFNLHGADYQKLGSVLVDLGNNAASTEGDIVAVGLRFGGVGRAAGLSIPQILAWSSTIASLGPLAEAGGSSLGRMFTRVIQYAGTGDKKLKAFAEAAGMSTEAFRKLVGSDTNAAFLKFITGLKGLDKLQLGAALKRAGITNVRDIQSIEAFLLRTDLLTDSLHRADTQWQIHNALLNVSDKRFATLKAHLVEFKNAILNAAVTVSEGMNPAIDRALQKLRTFLLLPSTEEDLKNLGRDIGEGIDKINWAQVIAGAKTLVGIMKSALDIIRQIPPEITAGIIGFGAVNKVSGGLIGQGLGDIIGGTIKAGIGQFFGRGSSPANPLYVSMGGPGLPGTPPGTPPGAPPEAGGPTGGGTAGAGIAVSVPAMNQIVLDYLHEKGIKTGGPNAIIPEPTAGRSIGGSWAELMGAQGPAERMKAYAGMRGIGEKLLPVPAKLDLLHQDFLAERALLKTGNDQAKANAAKKLAADVGKGVGNVATTKSVAEQLRATALTVKDPALRAQILASATRVERKLPGREWVAAQKAAATKIARSNEGVAQKVRELKQIERDLIAHGDAAAGRIIGNLITGFSSVVGAVRSIPTLGVPVAGARGNVSPVDFNPPKPFVPKAPGPTSPTHAGGLLGFTAGPTALGFAGEAGREAVAIIKHPHPIDLRGFMAGDRRTFVTNVRVSTSHRENAGAKALHTRYGKTASEAGAA